MQKTSGWILLFHHSGHFEQIKNKIYEYVNGNIDGYDIIDPDVLCETYLKYLLKKLGFGNITGMCFMLGKNVRKWFQTIMGQW